MQLQFSNYAILLEFNFRVRISRAVIISVLLYFLYQLLARKLFSPHDTFAPRGLRFSWDFVAFCVSDAIVRPQVIKGVSIWFYFFLIENTYWSQKVVILYHVILPRKVDLWYFSWVVHSSQKLTLKKLILEKKIRDLVACVTFIKEVYFYQGPRWGGGGSCPPTTKEGPDKSIPLL